MEKSNIDSGTAFASGDNADIVKEKEENNFISDTDTEFCSDIESVDDATASENKGKKKLFNRDSVLMLQASTISTLGDLMYSVAIGYWVYSKTGSTALMGIMSAISMFVTMILSPIAGSIVDRLNRKWVLITADLIQSAIMITIGIMAYADKLSTEWILIAALLAAFCSVFYSPSANTLMLDIIPHDDMVRGQSIFQGTTAFVNMVGSALSGVMVAFLGVPLIITINGLSNLYSAISEMFINVPKTIKQGSAVTPASILKDTVTAVKTIFTDKHLKLFIPSMLIINFLGAGPISLVLPFTMEKNLTIDMYGYIMSIWTAASIVGILVVGAIKFSPKARYWLLTFSFILSTISLIFAYLSNGFLPISIFIFFGSMLNIMGNAVFNASLMLALPEENRGAILGFIQSASIGGSALSTVLYGFAGEFCPLHILFTIGGVLALIPMSYLCLNKTTKSFILTH